MFWNLHGERCLIIFTNNRELFGSGGKLIFPMEFEIYCGRWEMRQESVEIKRKCKAITAETELRELSFSFHQDPVSNFRVALTVSFVCQAVWLLDFPFGNECTHSFWLSWLRADLNQGDLEGKWLMAVFFFYQTGLNFALQSCWIQTLTFSKV